MPSTLQTIRLTLATKVNQEEASAFAAVKGLVTVLSSLYGGWVGGCILQCRVTSDCVVSCWCVRPARSKQPA